MNRKIYSGVIMAQFPENIFNGLHTGRPALHNANKLNTDDYIILVNEIAATQKVMLEIMEAIKAQPGFSNSLSSFLNEVSELKEKVAKLSLPDDVSDSISTLESRVDQLSERAYDDMIQKEVAGILVRLAALEDQVKSIHSVLEAKVSSFQKNMLGMVRSYTGSFDAKLESLKEEYTKAIRISER